MILILITIIVVLVTAIGLMWYGERGYNTFRTIVGAAGFIMMLASGVSAAAYVAAGWSWFASEHKARIINREYGTNYTQEEVFWASDVIDTVRELDRKRFEINGNVMSNKSK